MSKFIQVNPNLNKYTFVDVDNLLAINQLNSGSGYLFRDTSGQWQLTNIPTATSTIIGGVKLFSDTVQTVAANNITTTASRTYGIQTNSNGQLVVNVPWTTYSTGSLSELESGTATTSRVWSSNVLNSWINSKNYITDASLPTVGNGILSFVVPTGLSISGTFSANQSTNSSFNLSYSTGYQGYTTNESNKLANIESNANNYTLPISSASILGGVMIGSGLSINSSGLLTNASPNIIQTLSQSGQVVTLSNGGGSFTLPTINETITTISRDGVAIPIVSQNVDIPLFSTTGAGLVPPRVGSVSTKYLREDGTWVTPTNTTYLAGTLELLQAGTNATNRVWSPSILNTWLSEKGYITSYVDTVTRLRGTATGTYTSGDITFLAGSNTTITQSGNSITISSTDTNTTYSAGTGLSLTGTIFGQTITTSGTGSFVTGVTQTANGFQVNLGTPPNTTYTTDTLTILNTGTSTTGALQSSKNLNDWLNGKGFSTQTLTAGTNINIVGNVISAVDTNTTYSAGSGLTLSDTTFSLPITYSGTGNYVSAVTQTTNGLTITRGTLPDVSEFVPYTGATANVDLDTRSITSTGGFIGNASTASTLQTARTINGTSFNGSANITTANWGTARNITIGNKTLSVNGSGNYSWSLAEIGAVSQDSLDDYLPLAGGTMLGNINFLNNSYGISVNDSLRLRFTSVDTFLSSDASTGSNNGIYLRPQGPSNSGGQVTIWSDGTIRTQSDGDSSQWKQAYDWGNHALAGYTLSSQLSDYVPTSRTITINGVAQNLSANRTWTIPDTVTRLRGTTAGTYTSGDLTLLAGANTTITQTGATITIASTNTNTTYSGSTSIILSGTSFQRAALTGDVTAAQNSNATTIANNAVTFVKMQNIATQRLLGRGTAETGNIEEITLGSGISLSTAGVLSATGSGGTVTSVGLTIAGNALNTNTATITNSGTFGLTWGGTAAQYVNGQGTLVTFPTIPTVGNGSLTIGTPTGLSSSGTFTANQSGNSAITLAYTTGYQGYTTAEATKLAGIAANANNYTLPAATNTILGGVKLFSNTNQSVAANVVTSTASRTYGIQTNATGQLVVNVPWTDTNIDTTYAAGTLTVLNAAQSNVQNTWSSQILNQWLNGKNYLTPTAMLTYSYQTSVPVSSSVYEVFKDNDFQPLTNVGTASLYDVSLADGGGGTFGGNTGAARFIITYDIPTSTWVAHKISQGGSVSANIKIVSGIPVIEINETATKHIYVNVRKYRYLAQSGNGWIEFLGLGFDSIQNLPTTLEGFGITNAAKTTTQIVAGNGLTGGGSLATNRTITMGTPGAITLSSTNSVTTSSHTHTFTPGGTTAQYIRGDGSLASFPSIPSGTITSIGMTTPTGLAVSPSTITSSGTFALTYSSGYQGYTTAEATKLAGISANANNYTLPTATATVLGGVKLFSNTTQTVAATAVTATASRTYGIQMNSDGQLVVNVPWVDTNTNTTYSIISASELTTGTATTGRIINAKVLTDWINGFNFLTVDNNTTYTAGNGLTLSGTAFSLPVTQSGSGNIVSSVVASTNGLTVTKANISFNSLTDLPYFKNKEFEIISANIVSNIVTLDVADNIYNDSVLVFINGIKLPKSKLSINGQIIQIDNTTLSYQIVVGDLVEVEYLIN